MARIDARIAAAFKQVRRTFGRPVRYVRGEEGVAIPDVPKGPPRFATAGIAEVLVDWQGWDWLVPADELVLSGTLAEPRPGDRIMEMDARSIEHTHEVMPAGDEPCWRWSDPGRTVRRIHTKEVAES